jgi:16S rRNA (adenine1518-N6/adenine1519-N6)-dimethyltransferase
MKRLGQYSLVDQAILRKIVFALSPERNETVIEIGPGHGELTHHLIHAREDLKIIAVEKDSELALGLEKIFSNNKKVEIVRGDILKVLPSIVKNLPRGNSYKIIGNIPYYITGHLLRTIGELDPKPYRSVLTVQKEVAERVVAQPPKMNRLAASIQYWSKPRIIFSVSKSSFDPKPRVDSAILSLDKLSEEEVPGNSPDAYYEAVRVLFQQPRKTILNNIASGKIKSKMPKTEIVGKLERLGIDPLKRPQNLDIDMVIKISKFL